MSIPGELKFRPRLLMGPGPSDVHPRVLSKMAMPLLGHLDPQYLAVMNETQEMLRLVYRTTNRLTLAIPATGMGGMETCLVNLLEPNDRILICRQGFFGQRMVEVAERTGANVFVLDQAWGQVFDLDLIREEIRKQKPQALGIVYAETSTGTMQTIESLGKICQEFDCLLIVDAVTALGCIPLEVEQWSIDAVYSCSQKGLACPPGLSPVSFSERAYTKIKSRRSKPSSWYFDITLLEKYWGTERVYHHTAPISMTYALHEGLRIMLEEGMEQRWQRHRELHRVLCVGLEAMGLRYLAASRDRLPQLNAVLIPHSIDDAQVRTCLLEEFGIEIGGGLGEFKGKLWRIGLMGYNCRLSNVMLLLTALESALHRQGFVGEPGRSIAAAMSVASQQNQN
jgi:alanine-glyoxylate transaminase / serine-glyoxylate transaminase / serine-pyruvate transaminase